jgi:tetratricopeptide (TPR) repeat protein
MLVVPRMRLAEGSGAPARPLTSAGLRGLWESGQRARAIRAALDGWEQLERDGRGLDWLQNALRRCGLEAEAFALQAENTRRRHHERDWETLIHSVLQSGDPWWARQLITQAGHSTRELQALGIETELRLGRPLESVPAWLQSYQDEGATEAAVSWLVRGGEIAEAERLLEATPGLNLWRARLALWRNQPGVARSLLERSPTSPETRVLEAIATVLEDRLQEAEMRLRSLLARDAAAEAWSWLATVLRKQQRYAEAVDAAQAASDKTPTFDLVARLERELATEYQRLAERRQNRPYAIVRLLRFIGLARIAQRIDGVSRRTVADLEHAAALYPLGSRPDDPIGSLAAVLERFGGNHTPHLTTFDGGKLTAYRLPPDPRSLGASILHVLWTRGPDAARALYRELAPRVNHHPLFLIYQGELELWMGAYEEAERIFRGILEKDRRVKWAWIGLGASVMLQGDLRGAQKIWKKGVSLACAGPTLYVYRGECYRRQGNIRRARRDLERAVREKPQRLSAWINLALLNRDEAEMARIEAECTAFAPLLMAELSGDTAERLEGVLEAMRGNRRSTPMHICYHLWGRIWRRAAAYETLAETTNGQRHSPPQSPSRNSV